MAAFWETVLKRPSQLFTRPLRWRRACPGSSASAVAPGELQSWLQEAGSLTLRLRRLCGDSFRLVVLDQAWQKPFAEEARLLRLRPGQRALVREVSLQDTDRPLVVARSIIPLHTLHGADRRLARLGNRPLGHLLFADPRLQRLDLHVTRVEPAQRLAGAFDSGSAPIWGRRSLYSLGRDHTLLVAEFFLPELMQLTARTLPP